MILSDALLRSRLPELAIETASEARSFNADQQVNPASIDLRLSNVYWKPRVLNVPISFRPEAFGSDTVARFKQASLRANEAIVLDPGQFVLCRTYEKFSLPANLVGHLHSKSSYSRLGIDVASTGDFINPGWQGHMPLIIRNLTKQRVSLRPFTPIVQLVLTAVDGQIERAYTSSALSSKHTDDDGGPSGIWQRICREGLLESGFSDQPSDINAMIEYGKKLNPETRQVYLKTMPVLAKQETSSDVFLLFERRMGKLRWLYQLWTLGLSPLIGFIVGSIIGEVFDLPNDRIGFLAGTTVTGICLFLLVWMMTSKFHSTEELRTFRNEVGQQPYAKV